MGGAWGGSAIRSQTRVRYKAPRRRGGGGHLSGTCRWRRRELQLYLTCIYSSRWCAPGRRACAGSDVEGSQDAGRWEGWMGDGWTGTGDLGGGGLRVSKSSGMSTDTISPNGMNADCSVCGMRRGNTVGRSMVLANGGPPGRNHETQHKAKLSHFELYFQNGTAQRRGTRSCSMDSQCRKSSRCRTWTVTSSDRPPVELQVLGGRRMFS